MVLLAALGGCGGGGDVRPRDKEVVRAAPPSADAGRGTQPAPADAGSPLSGSSDAGKPVAPAAPAPEGARNDPSGDERLIGSLSADELQRLCQDGRSEVARAVTLQAKVQCTATAIALTKTPEQCRTELAKCMSQTPASPLTDDTCSTDAPALAEDCAEVSVGDVRACSEAWTKKLQTAAGQIDCNMAGAAREAPPLDDSEECQKIDTRCLH